MIESGTSFFKGKKKASIKKYVQLMCLYIKVYYLQKTENRVL